MIKKNKRNKQSTFGNVAYAPFSSTRGFGTEAKNFGETAYGVLNNSTLDEDKFNSEEIVTSSKATIFSVGNGTPEKRSNAIEIKANGDIYFNGVGGYDGTNAEDSTSFTGAVDEINQSVENIQNTVDSINIKKINNLQYDLMIDDELRSSIIIPEDRFLKDIKYNDQSNILTLTFSTTQSDGTTQDRTVDVDLNDLQDIYTAGNGLDLGTNKQFSVKVNPDTESYIVVDENGVKITGLDQKFADIDAKNEEQDSAFESYKETQAQKDADQDQALTDYKTSNDARVKAVEDDLDAYKTSNDEAFASLPDTIVSGVSHGEMTDNSIVINVNVATKQDDNYASPVEANLTFTGATQSTAGLMSATDKTKVDLIKSDGDGTDFLANDGTYKFIQTDLSEDYAPSEEVNEALAPVAGDSYQTAISKLHKATLDNEDVLSQALVNINESVGLINPNQKLPDLSTTNYLQDAKSIVDCLVALDTEMKNLSDKIDTLMAAATIVNVDAN